MMLTDSSSLWRGGSVTNNNAITAITADQTCAYAGTTREKVAKYHHKSHASHSDKALIE
ncbi:hypothetical protein GW750_05545 [bacterium]|nr:hypothetical protein [bacterium]